MTREERIARAEAAFAAHKAAYYRRGEYRGADFWDFAEIFEIADDLYEITGDRSLFGQFAEMADFAVRTWGEDWEKNPYNDDIMWLVIAFARAYLFSGEARYLALARLNFDKTFARAASDDLGGGLWWRIENETKNACVNGPGAVAAAYLAAATGDGGYYDKAAFCLRWEIDNLFAPQSGKVYDAKRADGHVNTWSSTYNQGTFIGACLAMWKHTGEEMYKTYALRAADYTMQEMYHGGVMNNEESGNDLPGFKGILARYLRRLARETGEEKYLAWLRLNAESAWENRNALGLMGTQLAEKTGEGAAYDVFTMSAAVSVVVNAAGE